jgi:hypothetical protein
MTCEIRCISMAVRISPVPPLLSDCGALLGAIFSPVRQVGRCTVNPLIILALMARLRVVFGAKTKISAVNRQKQREAAFPGLFLPARSLRGRPASLRTVPDGAGVLLRKRLIWRALLVMRSAISGVGPIFLPALRELGGSVRSVGPSGGLGMPFPAARSGCCPAPRSGAAPNEAAWRGVGASDRRPQTPRGSRFEGYHPRPASRWSNRTTSGR